MHNFKNSVIMSRKNIRPAAFLLQLVLSAAHNRLKNLSTAVNATRRATRILLREVNQNLLFFFAQKLSNLAPVLKKLMQLKRVTEGSIVTKYVVSLNGGLGAEPQPLGDFRDFAAKNSNFNAILITIRTF